MSNELTTKRLQEFLNDYEKITMREICEQCFKIEYISSTNQIKILLGKLIKKIGWKRYQDSDGKWYYYKHDKASLDKMLNLT